MDKVFTESGFVFDFSNSLAAYKADQVTYHDLASVDFVVETVDNFIFIEVKNPDNINARTENRIKFLSDLQNRYFPYKMADKYKNVLLAKWSRHDDFSKPILCVFILECKALTKTDCAKIKEKIFCRLPFSLNRAEWGGKEIFEKRFELLSIEKFREVFPAFPVALCNAT